MVCNPLIGRSTVGLPDKPLKLPTLPATGASCTLNAGLPCKTVELLMYEMLVVLLLRTLKRVMVAFTCESEESYHATGLKSFGEKVEKGLTFGKTLLASSSTSPHLYAKNMIMMFF